MNDDTPTITSPTITSPVCHLSVTVWTQVRARQADVVRWMAEAPAAWMGIPTWARWFRRISALRGRDLAIIPPAQRPSRD